MADKAEAPAQEQQGKTNTEAHKVILVAQCPFFKQLILNYKPDVQVEASAQK